MQPIIPPIGPNSTGNELTNLQECILFLLDKNIFTAYQPPSTPTEEELKKYREMLKEEKAGSVFGDATRQLIYVFQIQQGLGDGLKGMVEETTAAKLNEFLKELGALDTNEIKFLVKGFIYNVNGEVNTNIIVRAFDCDLRRAELLGETTTDEKGYYEIKYVAKTFANNEKGNADIKIVAQDLKNQLNKESEIYFNASPVQEINLTFPALPSPKEKSEWEITNELVLPLLRSQKQKTYGVGYEDLMPEELKADDFEFISKETGLAQNHLHLWSLAYGRSKEINNIGSEMFFGWFRMELPTELKDLWARTNDELLQELKEAIDKNIIPVIINGMEKMIATINEARQNFHLQPAKEGEKARLGDMLNIAGKDWLSDAQKRIYCDISKDLDPDADEDFNEKINAIGFTNDEKNTLQKTLRLDKLTLSHPRLMEALYLFVRSDGDASLKSLATIHTDQWIDLAYTHGVPTGSMLEPEDYAILLADGVEDRLPTASLANKVSNGEILFNQSGIVKIAPLLNAISDFDIVKDDIAAIAGRHKLDDESKGLLKSLQNLKKLGARWEDTDAFISQGITSVQQIVEYSPEQLKVIFKDEVEPEKITTIQSNAIAAQNIGIGLMGYLQPMFSNVSAYVMGSSQPEQEQLDPTLRKLFVSQEQCACTPCRSVLSPAAYYADLLKFIDSAYLAGYMLETRRPDLFDLELSCDNAAIELPHIDLALEILENAVALPLSFTLPASVNAEDQLSKNQIGAEIRQVLQQTSEEMIGNLIAEKDNHTTRPRPARPGVSYWTVKDQYRRWLITISKEAFGSATDIAANTGPVIQNIDFGLLTDWLNGNGTDQNLPAGLKIIFEQLLLNNIKSVKGPRSIRSYKVSTNEESRNWTVSFTTGSKISTGSSSNPDKMHITIEAEDGSTKETWEYNSKTVEAAEKGLDKGEKKSILIGGEKNKNETIDKGVDQWIITGHHTIQLFYTVAELAIEGLTYQSTATDRQLLVKPQHKNPLAYEKLVSVASPYPWSLPFDQCLSETRLLMEKSGLPFVTLLQSILPSGAENKDFRWSIEQLKISPAQGNVILTTLTGEPLWLAWGLKKTGNLFEAYDHSAQKAILSANGSDLLKTVSILTKQANITIFQLEELLACSCYLNPNYLVSIQYNQYCELDNTVLSITADEAFFDRLHRFIRLWVVTKFNMSDLDQLLLLFPSQAGALSHQEVFVYIANIRALELKLQLPASLILAFYQVFDNKSRSYFTNGERRLSTSLYGEIFLNKSLQNIPDSDFEFQKFSAQSGAHPKVLAELVPHISLCLGIYPEDIHYLVRSGVFGFGNQQVNITVLHHIWRHIILLKALDTSIEEYVSAVRLISPTANIFSTPATLSDFCREVSFMAALGIRATELISILEYNSVTSLFPNETIVNILRDLQVQLRQTGETDAQDARSLELHKQKQLAAIVQVLSPAIEIEKDIIRELISNKIFTTSAATISALEYFLANTFWQQSNNIVPAGIQATIGYAILLKLKKISLLNRQWNITNIQATWFRKSPAGPGFTGIIPNSLPVAASNSPVSYYDWKKSVTIFSFSKQALISEHLVADYLTALGTADTRTRLTNARQLLAAGLGIDIAEVNHGAVYMGIDQANQINNDPSPALIQEQFDPLKFAGLLQYLFLLKRYGLTKSDIDGLLLTPANTSTVQKARRVLTQIYADNYGPVLQPINNQIRIEQRDRLVDYLCFQNDIKDSNSLYEHFLIDVQMQPCMRTTRLLQSTAAAQLFVHRALMNLEQPYVKPDFFDHKRWEWTQNYRVWEANRKVFLYPENWLYPELRDDKTEIFRNFENNIHQDEANDKNAKQALIEYTVALVDHSKIIVMGMHEYAKQINVRQLFQVGRTINPPYSFYWREATIESLGTKWTGWNRIDQNLSSDHLVPFSYMGEMYISWPVVNKIDENGKHFYDVGLSWIKKTESGWSESKKSYDKIKIEMLVNRDERSMFLLKTDENITDINQAKIEFYLAKPATQNNWYPTNLQPSLLFQNDWTNNKTLISIQFVTFIQYNDTKRIINTTFGYLYIQRLIPDSQNPNLFIPGNESHWSPAYQNGLITIEVSNNSNNHFINLLAQSDQSPSPAQSVSGSTITLFNGKNQHYVWNVVFNLPNDPEPQIKSVNEPVNMTLIGAFSMFKDKDGEWLENRQSQAFELVPPANTIYYCSGLKEISSSSSKIEIPNRLFISSKSSRESFFCVRSSKSFSLKNSSVRYWQIEEAANKFLVPVNETNLNGDTPRTILLSGHPESIQIRKLSMTENSALFDYQLTPDFVPSGFGKKEIELAYDSINIPVSQLLPFNAGLPNGLYNWEVFYHTPIMAASHLSSQHRYAEARKWFHFVFDPTTSDPAEGPERFWKFLPFRNNSNPASSAKLMDILANPNSTESEKKEVRNQIAAWIADPFNPFAVARMRIGSFQWHTVISYIKNLIQWGDQLFRRDTRESINEATMLYVTAYNILGPRPHKMPKRDASAINMSYRELGNLDDFSNRWVTMIDTPFGKAWLAFLNLLNQQGINPHGSDEAIKQLLSTGSAYFCIPPNEKITELWNLTEDRLFKIRNCRNIEGVVRSLPLLDPPIDPELLIRAKAKGVSISDAVAGLYAPAPFYRFSTLFQKAMEICNEVKNLGTSLLGAIEKKEAEHLSLMRSGQEIQMQQLISSLRKEQMKEATAQIDSLKKTRENIIARILYLQKQIGVNEHKFDAEGIPVIDQAYITQAIQKSDPLAQDFSGLGLIKQEEDQILWMQTNNVLNLVAGGFHTASGLAHTAGAGFASLPMPADGAAKVADAIGKGLSAYGTLFNTLSSHYAMLERRSGQMAGWQRRRDEWLHLAKTAVLEIQQLDKQMIAADIKLDIATKELQNHQKQMEYTRELDEYIRTRKFSKETMYTWMEKQLSDLYFSAYQLAVDYAAKAEKAYQFELGEPLSNFLKTGYWDNLQKGLLTGEALMQDLRRMEAAYFDNNKRDYEIVKHISLSLLDPLSLLQLKNSGICQFSIPEVLFDMDFPGQYFRRIKSVSISMPCIAGPFTSVSATLSLTGNQLRRNANSNAYDPSGLENGYSSNQPSIATSHGQNDSGMFELNFRDERYLPFEGCGAISTWNLELPEIKQFDYNTISDLVVHLKFTARFDSGLKDAASDSVKAQLNAIAQQFGETGLHIPISLKHDMPNQWNQLVNKGWAAIKIDKSRLPYMATALGVGNAPKLMLFTKSKISRLVCGNRQLTENDFVEVTGVPELFKTGEIEFSWGVEFKIWAYKDGLQVPPLSFDELRYLDATALKLLDELIVVIKYIVPAK